MNIADGMRAAKVAMTRDARRSLVKGVATAAFGGAVLFTVLKVAIYDEQVRDAARRDAAAYCRGAQGSADDNAQWEALGEGARRLVVQHCLGRIPPHEPKL